MGHRFEQLVLTHLDAAYSLARFIVRDAAAADDVVQESSLKAFRSFGQYRGGDARSWLLAIVRNCSFDWTRAHKRVHVLSHPEERGGATRPPDADDVADAPEAGPEATVIRDSEIDVVRRMIGRLPDPFREALVLRELEELSYKQISQVTGVPIGTVMSRLARARRMLTEELNQPLAEAREPSR